MPQSVVDSVKSAVAQVRPPDRFGAPMFAMEDSEPVQTLTLADLEAVVNRHVGIERPRARQEGYGEGLRHGRNEALAEAQTTVRASAGSLGVTLSAVLDVLTETLGEKVENGKRDRRTRAQVREQAMGVLVVAREVESVLMRLSELIFDD